MNPVTPGAIMSIRLERDADREIIGDLRQLGARVVPLIDRRIRPRVPDAAAYSLDGFEEAIGPTVWRTEPAVMPLAPLPGSLYATWSILSGVGGTRPRGCP
jgi:hypothetical protein